MDKNILSKLIRNPKEVSHEDLQALKLLTENYGYFLAPFVLAALAKTDIENLQEASIRTPNREYLRKLLEGERLHIPDEEEISSSIHEENTTSTEEITHDIFDDDDEYQHFAHFGGKFNEEDEDRHDFNPENYEYIGVDDDQKSFWEDLGERVVGFEEEDEEDEHKHFAHFGGKFNEDDDQDRHDFDDQSCEHLEVAHDDKSFWEDLGDRFSDEDDEDEHRHFAHFGGKFNEEDDQDRHDFDSLSCEHLEITHEDKSFWEETADRVLGDDENESPTPIEAIQEDKSFWEKLEDDNVVGDDDDDEYKYFAHFGGKFNEDDDEDRHHFDQEKQEFISVAYENDKEFWENIGERVLENETDTDNDDFRPKELVLNKPDDVTIDIQQFIPSSIADGKGEFSEKSKQNFFETLDFE